MINGQNTNIPLGKLLLYFPHFLLHKKKENMRNILKNDIYINTLTVSTLQIAQISKAYLNLDVDHLHLFTPELKRFV